MKASIEQLRKDIADAKSRQLEASKDVKRIEKDIKDFSNNKDSKLAELQSSLDMLKKTQCKDSISVKTLQKDLQAARLDSEQSGGDLEAAGDQLAEARSTLKLQEDEIKALQKEHATVKVCVVTTNLQVGSNIGFRTLMTSHKHTWMMSEQS